jgi:1-acyl-sn-glycerol-3-phosphate acyltransferase
MKIYHNDEKNKNKRNEPFLRKMVHYMVSFGISLPIFIVYYLTASFFKYNSNFKSINVKLMKFFIFLSFHLNTFLLRKSIFKIFHNDDIPKNGCFIVFNHVNEFEYPYDFYFGNGVPLFDMGVKKLGPLSLIIERMGIALKSGRQLKQSIEEINEYLKVGNIVFYPEGERTFLDKPKTYKRGILKLVYDGQHQIVVIYKGGMEKLDNNLYYYKSEVIDSKRFTSFEDFYQYIITKNSLFYKG